MALTDSQEHWGPSGMGQALGYGKLLDQMPGPHPCRGLLCKSLSLLYPPLDPAPPSTSDPVGTLCKTSVGGMRVLAAASFLTGMSCSRSSTSPLELEVLIPEWERAKAARYLWVIAGGWFREK